VIVKRLSKLPNGSRLSPGLRNSAKPLPTRRLVLTAAGALLLPRAAGAQGATHHRIAVLSPGSPPSAALEALRQGLSALGYGDEALEIEIRYADGHMERLPGVAAELVRLAPEVIVAGGPAAVQAAKQATATIPIVMVNVADPVGAGFVASLAHPDDTITGLANLAQDTVGKRLQLLKGAAPGAGRIAILVNPANRGNLLQFQAAQQAAPTLRIEVLAVEARAAAEIDGAFDAVTRDRVDALFVAEDPVFTAAGERIVELAASRRSPAIYQSREWVRIGGLMSYGADLNDLYRHVAAYVDKILKGAKPADLPVEQPTKFQLVVNMKTAQALGLTIPTVILAGADEVIE
jgi:putative tryptophan/tyrosine transport system substrate-binding protein